MLNLSFLTSSPGFTLQSPKLSSYHRFHPVSCCHSFTRASSSTASSVLGIKTNAFLVFTKSPLKKTSIKCRYSDYYEQQQQQPQPPQRFTSPGNESSITPQQGGGIPSRVYVGHSIYKGKAALTVEPRPPEFTPLDSGAFKLAREGYVLLQFAPAAAARQYDWSRKQVFSLSVNEIGSVISLGARESCEFFHDPFKGKSDEGKVRKVLKVEPLPDGTGHFFNLSVQNKLVNIDESIYIPVSKAEYAILVSAFNFIVPYLLGWHTFVESVKPETSGRFNSSNSRPGDFEWSR